MDTKVLIYDEECGSLYPDRGRLFVFAYKWVGEPPTGPACKDCGKQHSKVFTPSVMDYNDPCGSCGLMRQNDRDLVKEAHRVLSQADVVLTFNGKNFDEKMVVTKIMRERLPPLPPIRHIDLYQVARSKMRLTRKSLENISRYLRLKHQKTKLDFDIWAKAGEGDAKAMKYIRDHGAQDVLVTEELYLEHLRPYIPNHPRFFEDREPCHRCGGSMRKNKRVVTAMGGPKVQYKCSRCGAYETRAK